MDIEGKRRMSLVAEDMGVVAVLVPVYNAEKFLKRCVESILLQTYKDFRLFLIDDGSTDSSSLICDEFGKRDSRVIVLHQENRGACCTRQRLVDEALKISDVKWIAFIDSDDFVHSKYLEYLLSLAETDRTIGWVENCSLNEEQMDSFQEPILSLNYEKRSVQWEVRELLSDNHLFVQYNMLWGKLFPIYLFEKVKFPIESDIRYFEDGATTFKLIYNADKVVHSSEKLYYTVGSSASMTRRPVTEKRIQDSFFSGLSPILFYRKKGDFLLECVACVQYLQTLISVFEFLYTDKTISFDKEKYIWKAKKEYKSFYKIAKKDKSINFVKRVEYFLVRWCPYLYCKLKMIIKKR